MKQAPQDCEIVVVTAVIENLSTRLDRFLTRVVGSECIAFHFDYESRPKLWKTRKNPKPLLLRKKIGRAFWVVQVLFRTRKDGKRHLLSLDARKCKPKVWEEKGKTSFSSVSVDVPSVRAECRAVFDFAFSKKKYESAIGFSADLSRKALPNLGMEVCGMRFRTKGVLESVIVDDFPKKHTYVTALANNSTRMEREPQVSTFETILESVQVMVRKR